MIISGHPSGNPNSHQAFKAFADEQMLHAICVPWLPEEKTLVCLAKLPLMEKRIARLARRHFDTPSEVLRLQGRGAEIRRLFLRLLGWQSENLSYQANDWLMHKMASLTSDPLVTAVHSYEDCSLLQFRKAKSLGKACIYDMPIGYHLAWSRLHESLSLRFADWIASGGQIHSRFERPAQKREEMSLADMVLVPSDFVARSIQDWCPGKEISTARYGIDTLFWYPKKTPRDGLFTFLYAGQCSIRKGTPLLIEAWRAANLADARLLLVGNWRMHEEQRRRLPKNVELLPPVDRLSLRDYFHKADYFVAPTYFEGRALVIGEAMACGLPVITTPSSGCEDLVKDGCGRLIPCGDLEALIDAISNVSSNRDVAAREGVEARRHAKRATWSAYRSAVTTAVKPYL